MGAVTKVTCDKCGGECVCDGPGFLVVRALLVTNWNPRGDIREVTLCGKCRHETMAALGFCYDTGRLLSLSRHEYVTDVSVCGPNGGGLEDIAFNGIGGASLARIEVDRPDAPLVGKYEDEEELK